ncbi:hypothetical protein B566_EDAN002569 [Ephemera danica]|nr:hypothetical protein B566_EDAN002569 [Ephemera danica]
MAAWVLKMRALAEQAYIDDIENDEEGIAETLLDDEAVAQMARPGTSLRTAPKTAGGPTHGMRPPSTTGRPITGVVRPGSRSRPGTMEQALKTPRTARSARPLTSSSGMKARLGTASMLSEPGGPFIALSRLNMVKYAKQQSIAKPLFEYIYHYEQDIPKALELAVQGTQACNFKDWWWKLRLGRCYTRVGLVREAEQQFRSALRDSPSIPALLGLARVYTRLDQPLAAIQVCQAGLDIFPQEVALRTEVARLYEGMGDLCRSVQTYRIVLQQDATHIEAIACIGMHHFYSDQPEVSLRFYRRLLQTGIYSAELFNNLGLCCYYAQQYDMTITCFERALNLGVGDAAMATQALRLALVADPTHAPAFNNLGVLEARRGQTAVAQSMFQAAAGLAHVLFEPHYNYAHLANEVGQLHASYVMVQKALKAYPDHVPSKNLLQILKHHFEF